VARGATISHVERVRVEVLVVGAGFGRGFLPLYLSHPEVDRVGLCDIGPHADSTAAEVGITDVYRDLSEALATGRWDAVHIATPVSLHVPQTLEVLASGRACGSAVPMATSLDDIDRVLDAVGNSGYMMMETALYQREYFYACAERDAGRLGELSYLTGAHMQDLDGYPAYWMGFPPMQYATHVVAPVLGLTGARVASVSCRGSGRLGPQHRGDGANPFPVESALLELVDGDAAGPLTAQITMSFFENARSYTEGFSVYGEFAALEWPSIEGDPLVVHRSGVQDGATRGRASTRELVHPPDRLDLLPDELASFVRTSLWTPPGLAAVEVDASHGGSHPHLVHEFVSSVMSGRRSAIDERRAAAITAPGIVAHQSALRSGEVLPVPQY
jgi:predicted dehydrogenase